jgi:V8-like Glu-specific endopeptidase
MSCFQSIVLAAVLAAPAFAQDPLQSVHMDLSYDSGAVANPSANEMVVISFPVDVEGARWMRLEFAQVQLAGDVLAGTGAKLRITSLSDGAVQEMNAIHVEQWRHTSAYFNGDVVLVEVVAEPHTGANRIVLSGLTADLTGGVPESICGADNRVLSSDPRQGRLVPIGCTGWLINDCNTCGLTAGHCSGSSMQVLEFNVPLSNPDASVNHPGPQDQYSVDTSSVQTNGGQGVGNDWTYYGVFANSNTGLTPFQAQGARYTLTLPPPFNPNETIRITGYGVDSSPNTYSQVQQTDVGPWVTSSGSTLQYATDTEGGNSGSPIIHEQSGNAIGIHTHGGCTATGGQNSGTASSHSGLQAALALPIGICAAGIAPVGSLPTQMQSGTPVQITVQVNGSIVAGSVQLHYRYNGGTFVAQTMTSGGGNIYTGTLPAPQCGDTPQFYFSVQNTTCGTLTNPTNAPTSFYSATVAGIEVAVFGDNFQTDTGWTTSINGATAGQWERGVPVNDPNWAYDPATDGDGSGQCYLTQNAAGNTDVDGGSVTLTSPALDMSGGSCLLRYRYYLNLTVADGTDRLLVEMSSNGTAGPWVAVATHAANNGTVWTSNEISTSAITSAGLSFTSNMRVRFTANDGGTASIVEAGVDGIAVVRSVCSLFQGYCTSGSLGSVISATGSSSIAANDMVLHASNIPSNKNGLFFYGSNKQSTPFGNGTRCVASPTLRLPLLNSGAGNTLDFAVNYGALSGPGAISAGDLWNFQCWFRDGVGPFDLSNGLQVTFVP